MEFHDVLYGLIKFEQQEVRSLVRDLLDTTELHRLRNMRQMNFDVPLIQELGKSRRLPHSIGVAYISLVLSQKGKFEIKQTKELVAAALLHDAAIPPYGHLVETELKAQPGCKFDHAEILRELIFGTFSDRDAYKQILPGRSIEIGKILLKHKVDRDTVLKLVSPGVGSKSPIAADVDLDNIDNIHRMAVLLGWDGAKENLNALLQNTVAHGLKQLRFMPKAEKYLKKWLEFRENIYTMIIAHPECIPDNALQSDLVELAVERKVISHDTWFKSEPIFEEELRVDKVTSKLAIQLISGNEYQLFDYVWFKDIESNNKLTNKDIKHHMLYSVATQLKDSTYFVWFEKGLINRKISWLDQYGHAHKLGKDSKSCLIALVKRSPGGTSHYSAGVHKKWRQSVIKEFAHILKSNSFQVAFPEDYTGKYTNPETIGFEFAQ